jgi:hypothetical protein
LGTACQAEATCIKEHYDCLGGVCTLNPTGRAFVETNYVLEQPSALTNVVSVAKGLFSDTGFFLTEVAGLEGDAARVYYGGGDRLEQHDDGPDVYRWQLPDDLPSFLMRRLQDPEQPLQGNTWRSDVFDYELVALFGDEVPRGRLGFEAVQTQVTMTFDPDLTQIMEGRIEGYITRAEAERRELGLVDNCALSRLLCPAYDCTNDPPLATFAELLDCNGVPTDSDLDPLIEGNDAYRASIFFQSERVELVE